MPERLLRHDDIHVRAEANLHLAHSTETFTGATHVLSSAV
jgi:hypothetical protein